MNASFNLLVSLECQQKIKKISEQTNLFTDTLHGNPAIKEARCLGTILTIELHTSEASSYTNSTRKEIYNYFLSEGILLRPLGNTLYCLSPYTIEMDALHYIHCSIHKLLTQKSSSKN